MTLKSLALALLAGALALTAGDKSFADTKEFRKADTQKGYLLQKFDVYSKMREEPKGTNCDWVMADGFDLAELRKEGATMHVGSFAVTESGYFGGWFQNPIVQSFEQSLGTKGIRLSKPESAGQAPRPMPNQAAAFAQIYKQNPQALEMMIDQRLSMDQVGNQMELDRYNEDKKTMSIDEAAKRAETRKAERRAKIRAELLGENTPAPAAAEPAAAPAKPKNPEEAPGYQIVFYVTESKDNSSMWSPVATNTTTAEFVIFKDGKVVLAARHNAASMGFGGGSGAKCGQALASALDIVIKKS